MRVLIIHHLEPCWGNGYKRFCTSFDELQQKFLDYLEQESFDRIILTRFEEWEATIDDGYYAELLDKISKVHSYAYGWEREEMDNDPERFCEGGNHSGAVLIDDWMLPLKRATEVVISGAFDGECIEDLEIALRHLEIAFKREESLIV